MFKVIIANASLTESSFGTKTIKGFNTREEAMNWIKECTEGTVANVTMSEEGCACFWPFSSQLKVYSIVEA